MEANRGRKKNIRQKGGKADANSGKISISTSDRHRFVPRSTRVVSQVFQFTLSFPRSIQDSRSRLTTPLPSVPPNCQFELDDAEDEWLYPMTFEYIHGRTLATCFSSPPDIIAKCFAALSPGGYLELQDMSLQRADDGSMAGTALQEWQTHVIAATARVGRVWTNVPNYARWMEEAGFVDVTEVSYRWPSCQWSAEKKERLLGAWTQAQIEDGMLESVSTRVFRSLLGWSEEELKVFLEKVRKDTRDAKIKAYSPM